MEQIIEDWLTLGLRSPTGDNAQPWIIRVAANQVYVRIDQEKSNHIFDQNNQASLLSLGMLAESLYQAGQALGVECEPLFSDNLSMIVPFRVLSRAVDTQLREILLARQTNRAPYLRKDISMIMEKIKVAIGKTGADVAGFMRWISAPIHSEVIDLWSQTEYRLWRHSNLMRDFSKWLRFSKTYQDGIHISSLDLAYSDNLLFWLLKMAPWFIHLVPSRAFKMKIYSRMKAMNEQTAQYVLFLTKDKAANSLYESGRKIMQFWLAAEENHLVCQPLAIQSLFIDQFSSVVSDTDVFSHSDQNLFFKTQQITRKMFSVEKDQCLSFLMRVGHPTKRLPFVHRRSLKSFTCKIQDGPQLYKND